MAGNLHRVKEKDNTLLKSTIAFNCSVIMFHFEFIRLTVIYIYLDCRVHGSPITISVVGDELRTPSTYQYEVGVIKVRPVYHEKNNNTAETCC